VSNVTVLKSTNNINTMSTDMHSDPPMNHLPEAAREIARRTADAARETAQRAAATARDVTRDVENVAGEVTNATKDAAKHATDTVKEMYHSAAEKAGDTLTTSKEYVRRNPVPVVLGAVAFGVALGYMLMMARRRPTFGERYADEPLVAVREAILGALAPVAHSVHKGYDSARDGAGKAMDRVHSFSPGRTADSLSHQIGRIGNNLKFW
jgi:ElaB/YqjD/DUF883 family membrane-anchored ribosome-binding protein